MVDQGLVNTERSRAADQLHDHVLPGLCAVRQDLEEVHPNSPVLARLDDLIAATRQLMAAQHPVLAQPDLNHQLRARLATIVADAHIVTELHFEDAAPLHLEQLLICSAYELVRNAAQHACATFITVRGSSSGDSWMLEVVDDGCGLNFDQLGSRRQDGHLGLARLLACAEEAGGQLTLNSGAGGTHITLRLPKRARPQLRTAAMAQPWVAAVPL